MCFGKSCSSDKACQLTAFRSYLEKTENWRQIYKQMSLTFIHQTMSLSGVEKKKLLGRNWGSYISELTA